MSSLLGKFFGRKSPATPASAQFDALYARAGSALAAQDFNRAILLYGEAIELDPLHAEAHYKRGNALRSAGQLEAAIESYSRSIDLTPAHARAYCNRGVAQQSLGQTAAALASYDRAIELDPRDAVAHYNRALLMQDLSRWPEALSGYEEAIRIDPQFADAQYNRAVALLSLGDFAKGWPAYEWRWKNARRLSIDLDRQFTQPLWLGQEPIAGKRLLLYGEAGLGDTIQFCRYAKLCAERGAIVILEVAQPLLGVLRGSPGVADCVVAGSAPPPFDFHCPLMSLPLALGTTLDSIPSSPAYLHADTARVERVQSRLGPRARPRVGLAWSGNPNNPLDARRSIPLARWAAHLSPEFQYYRLQNNVRATDQEALAANPQINSFEDDWLDIDNTAALCACMDLVVCVDTSVAHLSAALGRKTWLLLAHAPDWRWLQERSDSPWYPSLRLYRQHSAGDWESVLGRVGADMRQQLRA